MFVKPIVVGFSSSPEVERWLSWAGCVGHSLTGTILLLSLYSETWGGRSGWRVCRILEEDAALHPFLKEVMTKGTKGGHKATVIISIWSSLCDFPKTLGRGIRN